MIIFCLTDLELEEIRNASAARRTNPKTNAQIRGGSDWAKGRNAARLNDVIEAAADKLERDLSSHAPEVLEELRRRYSRGRHFPSLIHSGPDVRTR